MNEYEALVECTDMGKLKYPKRKVSHSYFVHKK